MKPTNIRTPGSLTTSITKNRYPSVWPTMVGALRWTCPDLRKCLSRYTAILHSTLPFMNFSARLIESPIDNPSVHNRHRQYKHAFPACKEAF